METLVERCAGLDVHKGSVAACVRVPTVMVGARPRLPVHHDPTGLGLLAEWLASYGVTRVGME